MENAVSHPQGWMGKRAPTVSGLPKLSLDSVWSSDRPLVSPRLQKHARAAFGKSGPRLESCDPRLRLNSLSGSAPAVAETGTGAGRGEKDGSRAFVGGVGGLFQHKRGGMREIKKGREWREEIKARTERSASLNK